MRIPITLKFTLLTRDMPLCPKHTFENLIVYVASHCLKFNARFIIYKYVNSKVTSLYKPSTHEENINEEFLSSYVYLYLTYTYIKQALQISY